MCGLRARLPSAAAGQLPAPVHFCSDACLGSEACSCPVLCACIVHEPIRECLGLCGEGCAPPQRRPLHEYRSCISARHIIGVRLMQVVSVMMLGGVWRGVCTSAASSRVWRPYSCLRVLMDSILLSCSSYLHTSIKIITCTAYFCVDIYQTNHEKRHWALFCRQTTRHQPFAGTKVNVTRPLLWQTNINAG